DFLYALARVLEITILILYGLIIARVLLSWLRLDPFGRGTLSHLVRFIYLATEPFLLPVRRVLFRYLPPMGLDLSPLVVILILILIRRFLISWLYRLALTLWI
ncbi:TPA: YggT family protein, partial [Candidatus Bipolaricaulota bacterium]|nr:YggT family protein [Candidatus Bipolaricaulota bacterium]